MTRWMGGPRMFGLPGNRSLSLLTGVVPSMTYIVCERCLGNALRRWSRIPS
jgi:hypothetical protein